MKKILLITLFYVIGTTYVLSQKKVTGIIADYNTKEPIEFVDIFNDINYTYSNENGKFQIEINSTLITFKLLGYKTKMCKADEVIADTIFLEPSLEKLNEVTITAKDNSLKSIYNQVSNNYYKTPYTENFFLRCVIKKDGNIQKIQDINGLVSRQQLFALPNQPMPSKNYQFEIKNMRKVGLREDKVNFQMYSLTDLFKIISSIAINLNSNQITVNHSIDSTFVKYEFTDLKNNSENTTNGYYVVNTADKAICHFLIKNKNNDNAYSTKQNIQYKTTLLEKNISFKKNKNDNLYYLNKAKINGSVIVVEENVNHNYEVEYLLFTTPSAEIEKVKKKAPNKIDIFKLKGKYKDEFWEKQNFLLLTDEMKEFVENAFSKTNEFKSQSNF